jgi:HEAT repeat protein
MYAFCRASCIALLLTLTADVNSQPANDPEAEYDEALLKGNQISSDPKGLQEFLRKRTLTVTDRTKVENYIGQLGHDRFPIRERATKELIGVGVPAIPFLEKSLKHSDQEVAERARRCLEEIRNQNGSMRAFAVLRTIERKNVQNAVTPILDFLPFADDSYVEDEAFRVLAKIGIRDGKPIGDPAGLVKDTAPVRRSAAGFLLGRSSDPEHRKLACKLLADADPWVQLRTAQGLLAGKEKAAIPAMIALLDKAPEGVAWKVEETLYWLAQEKAPAPAKDSTAAARQIYRLSWQKWWSEREASIDLATMPVEPVLRGLTVGVEFNTNTVWECGPDGKRRWTITGVEGPMDAQVLPGERVLIAEQTAHRVTERDLQGKVIWEKKLEEEALNARRLPNGNTFIGTRHRVMEVRPNGSEVFKYELSNEYLHAVRRLPNGGFLGLSNTGKIIETNSTGKQTRTVQLQHEGSWGDVESLSGGRYLVTNYASGFLREVDSKGNKLREVLFSDAVGLQMLPSGQILLSGTSRAAVVDWNGKIHWESKSDGCVRRVYRR